MRDRAQLLRLACLVVGAFVVFQAAQIAGRKDPLRGVSVPRPALAPATNTPASSAKGASNALPPPGPGPARPSLPPAVQVRVDKIIASEILGPAPRPMPLALLGIAGKNAFLRATNGQTGLITEGEALAGVKLLQIGTNRVIVEDGGVKKELSLFSGFGSEPLLPHPKENPQ